ncbi:hypothetical protein L1887_52124 [Cichorium endivia]|nr:hypothetical protein L1887_52124 [Cichorium endivia]
MQAHQQRQARVTRAWLFGPISHFRIYRSVLTPGMRHLPPSKAKSRGPAMRSAGQPASGREGGNAPSYDRRLNTLPMDRGAPPDQMKSAHAPHHPSLDHTSETYSSARLLRREKLLELLDVGLESALVDLESDAESKLIVKDSREGGHESLAHLVLLELDLGDRIVSGDLSECLDLLLDAHREAGQVDGPAVLGELFGGDVLCDDKVLEHRAGAADPQLGRLQHGVVGALTDGARAFEALEGFSDDTGYKRRSGGSRCSRTHRDSRKSHRASIDEPLARILGDEILAHHLGRPVVRFGSWICIGRNFCGQFATKHTNRRGKDDLTPGVSFFAWSSSARVESKLTRKPKSQLSSEPLDMMPCSE